MPMPQLETNRAGSLEPEEGGHNAFIPHNLFPDGISLDMDQELINLLTEASGALGELKGITEVLPDPDLFIAFYVQKEALLSSQIEGTQCSLDDILQVNEATDKLKPVHEVVNYIDAMNYGLARLRELPPSVRLLNEIHTKLLEGVRGRDKTPGQFKRSQNWVGPEGCTIGEADYVPPPPFMMQNLMSDFEKYYHLDDNIPALIKAAILHAQLETIHPYADGNGRIGRLLITFMLCHRNILNKPLLYLSLFFKEHRSSYYEKLMDVRFKGQWEEWIKFFLRGVRNTSTEAVTTAREILDLHETDRKTIIKRFSKYKMTIHCFDYICKNPITNIPQIVEGIKSTYPTIKKSIGFLMDAKIINLYGQHPSPKKYEYSKYLEILRRGT